MPDLGKRPPASPAFSFLLGKNVRGYAGGAGIKPFPNDLLNLHHWVFGEDAFIKVGANTGWPLPWRDWLYATDDGLPSAGTS